LRKLRSKARRTEQCFQRFFFVNKSPFHIDEIESGEQRRRRIKPTSEFACRKKKKKGCASLSFPLSFVDELVNSVHFLVSDE
jgi:hypothetical protein